MSIVPKVYDTISQKEITTNDVPRINAGVKPDKEGQNDHQKR